MVSLLVECGLLGFLFLFVKTRGKGNWRLVSPPLGADRGTRELEWSGALRKLITIAWDIKLIDTLESPLLLCMIIF